MAGAAQRVLNVAITGDAAKFGAAAGEANRNLEGFAAGAQRTEGNTRRMGAGFAKFGRALEKDVGVRVDKLGGGLGLLSNFIGGPLGAVLLAGALAFDTIGTAMGIVSIANIKAAASWTVHTTAVAAHAVAARTAAAAQWLLNASLLGFPVIAIIAGIIALGAAFVILWRRSETFRNIVLTVFAAVGNAALLFVSIVLRGFQLWANAWLTVIGIMVNGAAKAFGWVPGIGGKLKSAAKAFGDFKDSVNASFNKAIDKVDEWRNTLNNAPKIAKLKGDITDLQDKLDTAKRRLRDPDLTRERRARLNADIAALQAKINTAQAKIDSLRGRTVTVSVNLALQAAGGNWALLRGLEGRQSGGWVRRLRPYLVGERGPEVFIPQTAGMIAPNASTGAPRGSSSMGGMDERGLARALARAINGATLIIDDRGRGRLMATEADMLMRVG